jgi:hypothetical protein
MLTYAEGGAEGERVRERESILYYNVITGTCSLRERGGAGGGGGGQRERERVRERGRARRRVRERQKERMSIYITTSCPQS